MKIFFSWTGKSKHVKYFILLAFSSPVSSLMKWGRKGFLPMSRRTQNWSGFKAGIHVLIKTSSLAPSFSVLLDSFSIFRRWKTASTEESGSVAEVKLWLILAVQAADYYLGRIWPGWNPEILSEKISRLSGWKPFLLGTDSICKHPAPLHTSCFGTSQSAQWYFGHNSLWWNYSFDTFWNPELLEFMCLESPPRKSPKYYCWYSYISWFLRIGQDPRELSQTSS